MNKSPLNFLTTFAAGAILWVITAIFVGEHIAGKIPFREISAEDFLAKYRIVLAVAAALGLAFTWLWYYYGGKGSTASDLEQAKKVFDWFMIFEILLSGVLLFVIALLFINQGLRLSDYLTMFIVLSLQTWVFVWLCTFFMSPNTVVFCVWGRR